MKKMNLISLFILLMMAFPQTGQAQFLKKLNKALETVNKTLDDINLNSATPFKKNNLKY